MCCSKYWTTMSSMIAPLVVEKYLRLQKWRPQYRLPIAGNSRCNNEWIRKDGGENSDGRSCCVVLT